MSIFYYKILASRIHECLESIGLPVYVLSNAGKASLKNLTDLACNLEVKDVSKTRFNIFSSFSVFDILFYMLHRKTFEYGKVKWEM